MFYRSLPNILLQGRDLLRFALPDIRGDLRLVLGLSLLIGLMQMATPLATGKIFDTLIPQGDTSGILLIGLTLLVMALVSSLFQLAQSYALLRIEGKVDGALQPAIWDRLLELPVSFFRNYSAGDLGTRVMTIATMRMLISGSVAFAILASIASLFSLALLFYYSVPLALLGLVLVAIAMTVTIQVGRSQMEVQRDLMKTQGRVSGYMLQFINGISKFRIAGVEDRVFAFWARMFSQQRHAAYRVRTLQNRLFVFNAIYPILTSLILFAMIYFSIRSNLSLGSFLAFNTAFSQFLMVGLRISMIFTSLLAVVPMYERLQPVIQTLPEVMVGQSHPGTLSGRIEIEHVSFRYRPDAPLAVEDVSFNINPGEFVAVVGPSGSGKSTIFRLLLGFDQPNSGAILFDGQNLADLDLRSVRQQIGVVLQNGQLMSGSDIYHNIIGSATDLRMDDAWEAARMAGFDKDIEQMPMGMHTMIAEGAGTLSGGQRQRLLIARAIARKPRLIFFDEATSALDNQTQAIVSKSLEDLDATRLVIAHRLSTIINADRILVMHRGRLVQEGTYKALLRQRGLFADLANRQLV